MFNTNTPCIICHENNRKLNKLRRIETLLRAADPEKKRCKPHYFWDIKQRCRYGINGCEKLARFESENDAAVGRIEHMLESFIEAASEGQRRELLQLLRGDFPRVYTQVEREFHRRRKQEC